MLVNFFSSETIAERVEEVLDNPDEMTPVRVKAREIILEKYDLVKLFPKTYSVAEKLLNTLR